MIPRSLKRATAGLLIVLMVIQTTGCTTWMTVSTSVATVESSKHKVKVVLKEGGSVTTDSVRLRGDTLATYQPGGTGTIRWTEWPSSRWPDAVPATQWG